MKSQISARTSQRGDNQSSASFELFLFCLLPEKLKYQLFVCFPLLFQVDNNVTRHLDSTLKRDDWDILILHYLGLDHIGHISGPHSSLIQPKLLEMDDILKKIHGALISKVTPVPSGTCLPGAGLHISAFRSFPQREMCRGVSNFCEIKAAPIQAYSDGVTGRD